VVLLESYEVLGAVYSVRLGSKSLSASNVMTFHSADTLGLSVL